MTIFRLAETLKDYYYQLRRENNIEYFSDLDCEEELMEKFDISASDAEDIIMKCQDDLERGL